MSEQTVVLWFRQYWRSNNCPAIDKPAFSIEKNSQAVTQLIRVIANILVIAIPNAVLPIRERVKAALLIFSNLDDLNPKQAYQVNRMGGSGAALFGFSYKQPLM